MRERRKNRSDDPTEAARLYLADLARKLELTAICVANEDGLLISGSTGPASGLCDLEALAAISPLVDQKLAPAALTKSVACGKPVRTTQLDVGGLTLYLASVGKGRPKKTDAQSALARILDAA